MANQAASFCFAPPAPQIYITDRDEFAIVESPRLERLDAGIDGRHDFSIKLKNIGENHS
jgi:hypothetical protein